MGQNNSGPRPWATHSLTGEETRNQDSVPHSHTVYCNHIAWKTLGSIPESNFRRDLVGERSLSA